MFCFVLFFSSPWMQGYGKTISSRFLCPGMCCPFVFLGGFLVLSYDLVLLKEIKIRCNRTQHTTHAPADVFPSFSRPFFAAFLVGCFSPLNITPLQSHFDFFRLAVWRGTWLPLSLRSLRDYSEPLQRFLFFCWIVSAAEACFFRFLSLHPSLPSCAVSVHCVRLNTTPRKLRPVI